MLGRRAGVVAVLLGMAAIAGPAAGSGSIIVLPKGVKAEWVLPPEDAGFTLSDDVRFEVSSTGKLWLLTTPRVLVQTQSQMIVRLPEPVRDMVLPKSGGVVVVTDRCLAGLSIVGPDENKLFKADLVEIMLFPYEGFRLGRSGAGHLLTFGRNLETKKYEVYKVGRKGLRQKMLSSSTPITDVLQHGDDLYVAHGDALVKVDLKTKRGRRIMAHPEGISQIAWVNGVGIIFSTPRMVYRLAKPFKPLPFLESENCTIRGAGSALYVRTRDPDGILKITGLSKVRSKS